MPTRRQFVQVTAAAGVGSVLRAKGVLGANERINVGLIGCGGQGQAVWQRFLKQPDVNPVAVCDVYQPFVKKAVGESSVTAVKDFRRLLDRKDIDASSSRRPITGTRCRRSWRARRVRTSTRKSRCRSRCERVGSCSMRRARTTGSSTLAASSDRAHTTRRQ